MIADFRYSSHCHENDVVVSMFWDGTTAMGEVRFPLGVDKSWHMPDVLQGSELPLISAIAYALFVAGKAGRNLRLSGDRTAWPMQWGELRDWTRPS
jgi:hypothetical protein